MEAEGIVAGAIKRSNVLNKLCFVRYGVGLTDRQTPFQVDLIAHLAAMTPPPIQKQAIIYWFSRPSSPSREAAHRFLRNYLENRVDYDRIGEEQKKVHKQLTSYFRQSLDGVYSDKIHVSAKGSIVIDASDYGKRVSKLSETLVGVYVSYKMRFAGDRSKPLAREVIRVFRRRSKDLRFDQWYLKQGGSIDRFSGVVVSMGNLIWFFGAAVSDRERLRITCFRRTDELNTDHDHHRWGIALSDIPYAVSQEPAASRVVLIPARPGRDLEEFVKQQVAHLAEEELPADAAPIIMRLVDNHFSAFSAHDGIDPVVDGRGEPVADRLLQVDQRTMDAATELLLRLKS